MEELMGRVCSRISTILMVAACVWVFEAISLVAAATSIISQE
jgi:hypothetical protein